MSSSIPSAIQAFMEIAANALPPPPTTQVWFGKTLPQYVADITLQVNGTINGRQDPAELGPTYRREENYDFACTLTTWAGDDNYMQRMLDTFSNFALLTVALANNPQMKTPTFPNGVVRLIQVKTLNFDPQAFSDGSSSGVLTFTANCQARITSLT